MKIILCLIGREGFLKTIDIDAEESNIIKKEEIKKERGAVEDQNEWSDGEENYISPQTIEVDAEASNIMEGK